MLEQMLAVSAAPATNWRQGGGLMGWQCWAGSFCTSSISLEPFYWSLLFHALRNPPGARATNKSLPRRGAIERGACLNDHSRLFSPAIALARHHTLWRRIAQLAARLSMMWQSTEWVFPLDSRFQATQIGFLPTASHPPIHWLAAECRPCLALFRRI